jgi:hypothetical protein
MDIHTPTQTALAERHAELRADIECVADRANAARVAPGGETAAAIVEAAEASLVRVHHEWRKSRGGTQNNLFFDALSKRLRRIISFYKGRSEVPAQPSAERWVYRIIDYEEIDFRRLAPWFRASAVDDAIKMGIALGLRELPGLQIWKDEREA